MANGFAIRTGRFESDAEAVTRTFEDDQTLDKRVNLEWILHTPGTFVMAVAPTNDDIDFFLGDIESKGGAVTSSLNG